MYITFSAKTPFPKTKPLSTQKIARSLGSDWSVSTFQLGSRSLIAGNLLCANTRTRSTDTPGKPSAPAGIRLRHKRLIYRCDDAHSRMQRNQHAARSIPRVETRVSSPCESRRIDDQAFQSGFSATFQARANSKRRKRRWIILGISWAVFWDAVVPD